MDNKDSDGMANMLINFDIDLSVGIEDSDDHIQQLSNLPQFPRFSRVIHELRQSIFSIQKKSLSMIS